MSILGRGLESLIPKKMEAPEEILEPAILHTQAGLDEPVYRFYDEAVATVAGEISEEKPMAAAIEEPPAIKEPPEESIIKSKLRVPEVRRGPPSPAESGLRSRGEAHFASAKSPPLRTSESIFWIDAEKIEPNPYQPRREFGSNDLAALADSIRERGMLQPLLVTKREIDTASGLDVRYQLIAGERRWRAAKLAGQREVPVIIRTAVTPESEKLELALIENVQREDLNPIERARAFQQLVNDFGLMQKEVGERIGKSREVVANALRLLRLPEEIQAALASNSITEGHARMLLMLEHDPNKQVGLFNQIRTAGLSVRDTELAVRASGGVLHRPRQRRRTKLDPDSRQLLEQLEEVFGSRVKLMRHGEQGRIIVEFFSDEELQGILDRISRREEGYV